MAKNIDQSITEALQKIAPEIELSDIDPDEDLREAVELDSFDFLQVLTALGQDLGVEIPESDYPKLLSLSDMKKYLKAHI